MNVMSAVYSVKSVGTGKRNQLDGSLARCVSWHIRMPFYYCLVWKKGGHNLQIIPEAMDIGDPLLDSSASPRFLLDRLTFE